MLKRIVDWRKVKEILYVLKGSGCMFKCKEIFMLVFFLEYVFMEGDICEWVGGGF